LVCYSEENAISGPLKSAFTAMCVDGMAQVKVFVRDDCFLPVIGFTPESMQGTGSGDLLSLPHVVEEPTKIVEKPLSESCPRAELKKKDGTTSYSEMPIEIVSYGDSKVAFRVHQKWKKQDSVDVIATHYPTGE